MNRSTDESAADSGPSVALLVTCLVDVFRPSIGFAAVSLLEQAGCRVNVPHNQTCCGQPAYNSGDRANAAALALQAAEQYASFDYVVVPSGSCAGMVAKHYPALLPADDPRQAALQTLADKTYELISFLVDVLGVTGVSSEFSGAVTYHDSCSGLRELGN